MIGRMRWRLCNLSVSNFKALQDFTVSIPADILVLIGPNGVGKSTILQALTFFRYFAQGQPVRFFEDRGWRRSSTKSFYSTSGATMDATLLFEDDDGMRLEWNLSWGYVTRANRGESLKVRRDSSTRARSIYEYTQKRGTLQSEVHELTGLKLEGSVLSIVKPSSFGDDASSIRDLVEWLKGIVSLDIVSPNTIRAAPTSTSRTIGHQGELLASFIASRTPDQKERIVKRVALAYPALTAIETTEKKAGWIDLQIAERYSRLQRVSLEQVSDGFLRIAVLAAIPEMEEASIVLLDEIEDGIEPHVLGKFVVLIARESNAQLLATSHSPLLVNVLEPEQICFVSRAASGEVVAATFDELKPVRQQLKLRGSGEIWAQTSLDTVGRWIESRRTAKRRVGSGKPLRLRRVRKK